VTPDEPVFPPKVTEWAPPYIPPFDLPGYVIPPVGPGKPPCDPKKDPECPPPPPPDDVPEPATILILLVGILGTWLVFGRAPRARTE
jgi:hypothetical protein